MMNLRVLLFLFCAGEIFGGPSRQELNKALNKILLELPWRLRGPAVKEFIRPPAEARRVLMEPYKFSDDLVPARRAMATDDDNAMKVKLFRMMYESVKDCDMKVSKVEVMRNIYRNSSVFEIGYLLGDITDKYNVMTDIALTLKRLYHPWKPIEHVNAYEQIANQAIQINHLIEIMRSVHKKNSSMQNDKSRRVAVQFDDDY